MLHDVIIIGAGPAGLICGIEAQKKNLNYLILEKGLLVNSIYNFPSNMTFFSTSKKLEVADIPFISHTEKPTRKEALEYYRRLAEYYKLKIHFRKCVTAIQKSDDYFTITTQDGLYKAKNVVLALGFYDTPRNLNVNGSHLTKVKHYYDDAHQYIGMNIVVVGGGNSACDVALETWAHGANVTMVVRDTNLYQGVKYWILPNIENRIKEGSIPAYFNSTIIEIRENEVTINTPKGVVTIENDYVLAMIGYQPNYSLLDQLAVRYKDNENLVPSFDPNTLETNIKNVFVAGVMNAGLKTNNLFIENTRDHGYKIMKRIKDEIS